jgi:hypothetical protein
MLKHIVNLQRENWDFLSNHLLNTSSKSLNLKENTLFWPIDLLVLCTAEPHFHLVVADVAPPSTCLRLCVVFVGTYDDVALEQFRK